MSSHTPGPWTLDNCPDAYGNATIRPDDGTEGGDISVQPIATVYTDANAHLIAAAPEMLEALQEALADAETLNEPYRNEAVCERMRAVIAKARGEA